VEHQLAKLEIYKAFLHAPGVIDVRLEQYLQEVRPDISFVLNGELVAIEIQDSAQPACNQTERQMKAYVRKNIAVLKCFLQLVFIPSREECASAWERTVSQVPMCLFGVCSIVR